MKTLTDKVKFAEECYRIVGACFEVYNQMGCGFTEAVYQECLAKELAFKEIPFAAQPELTLSYRGEALTHRFRPDFLCFGKIIVEIKAAEAIINEFRSQTLNYLHASRTELGLLVNFGHHSKLQYERLVL